MRVERIPPVQGCLVQFLKLVNAVAGLVPPMLDLTTSGRAGGAVGCGAPTSVSVYVPPPVFVSVAPRLLGSNVVPKAV